MRAAVADVAADTTDTVLWVLSLILLVPLLMRGLLSLVPPLILLLLRLMRGLLSLVPPLILLLPRLMYWKMC